MLPLLSVLLACASTAASFHSFMFLPDFAETTIDYPNTRSCITTPTVVMSGFASGGLNDVVYIWYEQFKKIDTNASGVVLKPGYQFCLDLENGVNVGYLEATILNKDTGLLLKNYFTYIVNYGSSNTSITSINCNEASATQTAGVWALALDDADVQSCTLEVVVEQNATAELSSIVSFPPGNFDVNVSIQVTSAAKTTEAYILSISRALAPKAQFGVGCNKTRTFPISLGETSSPGLNLTVAQVGPPPLVNNPGESNVTGLDCWSNGGPCLLNVGLTDYSYSVANPSFNGVNTPDTICQFDIQVTAPTTNAFDKICCYVGGVNNSDTQCNQGSKVFVIEPEAASQNITCTGYSKDPNSNDTVVTFTCFQDGSNTCARTIGAYSSASLKSYDIDIQLDVPNDKLPLKKLSLAGSEIPLNVDAFVYKYPGNGLQAITLDYQTFFNGPAYEYKVRIGFNMNVTELAAVHEKLWGISNVYISSLINDKAFSETSIGFNLNSDLPNPYNTIWLCNGDCSTAEATKLCDGISVLNSGTKFLFCYQIAEDVYAVRGDSTAKTWAEDNFQNINDIKNIYQVNAAATSGRNGRGLRAIRNVSSPMVRLTNSEYSISIELTNVTTGFVYASERVPSGVYTLRLEIEKTDDVIWTTASDSSEITSELDKGTFTYSFTYQDSNDIIHTCNVVVFTDPPTANITDQLACDEKTNDCPKSNGIFFGQTAVMTLRLDGTNKGTDGNLFACKFKVSSLGLSIESSPAFNNGTVTLLDSVELVVKASIDDGSDQVGTVIIEPFSKTGCQIAAGELYTQSDINIYTKIASLTGEVSSKTIGADQEIRVILQVPPRYAVVRGSAAFRYPFEIAASQVDFMIPSQETSVEVVFESVNKRKDPVKYAYGKLDSFFQLFTTSLTNAKFSPEAVADALTGITVQFRASPATVNLTVENEQGGSSADDPIILDPRNLMVKIVKATMSKIPLNPKGIQLQVTMNSPKLTASGEIKDDKDDYLFKLDRIEGNQSSCAGSVEVFDSAKVKAVKAGTADQSFTVSVMTSAMITSANTLHFLIKAPVITITSSNFDTLEITEGTLSSPYNFTVNWATGTDYAFYELKFELEYEYGTEYEYYDFISNTVGKPGNFFEEQKNSTFSELVSGTNGVVDDGNLVIVTPYALNVNVRFEPAYYTIYVANTEKAMVTLKTSTSYLGKLINATIQVSLPIGIAQEFTYSIVQDGKQESGVVTLPPFTRTVDVPYTTQLSGYVSMTVVAIGQLSSSVICVACEAEVVVISAACVPYGGDVVLAGGTRHATSSFYNTTADDGLYESTTGWIGNSNATYNATYIIDLVNQRTVIGIKMRGNADSTKGAVVAYDMDWSADGLNWTKALTGVPGSRTGDNNAATISYMAESVETAILIRITPTSFNIQPSMRVEVIGCMNNPCNDSISFTGSFGSCESYAPLEHNHKYCGSDKADPTNKDSPSVESVCEVACGKCGVQVDTETPTGAPTETPTNATESPTSAIWPLACKDDPNFKTEWAGAYGNCSTYNQTLCTNADGSPNLFCNFYYCAVDGADYYCPYTCGTCADDYVDFISTFDNVNCTYYKTHQSECDGDTNINYKMGYYGLRASELCTRSCVTYPKKPDDSAVPKCEGLDPLTSPNGKTCANYDSDTGTETQFCKFDGVDAIDECPIACGTCTDCDQVDPETCKDNCNNPSPYFCPYAFEATCYCDDNCEAMEDCCPGFDTHCREPQGPRQNRGTKRNLKRVPLSSNSNGNGRQRRLRSAQRTRAPRSNVLSAAPAS